MIIKENNRAMAAQDGPRANGEIKADKVRVVLSDGGTAGIVSLREALNMAEEAGLDLVEISPNAEPPVCKILDLGKFKYEMQKKKAEAKKKQKVIEIKEIKVSAGIGEHDYDVKLKAAAKFLESGNKVKVTLKFKGREIAYQDKAMELMNKIISDLELSGKVEQPPKLEGKQIGMLLAPKSAKEKD